VTEQREQARLRWRCRRGMKELDVLLERFLSEDYPSADAGRRRAFERLLEQPDPELAAWLLGQAEPPDPELAQLTALVARRPA
jgi:antitoxin CptB